MNLQTLEKRHDFLKEKLNKAENDLLTAECQDCYGMAQKIIDARDQVYFFKDWLQEIEEKIKNADI